jgi:hypothetical protein
MNALWNIQLKYLMLGLLTLPFAISFVYNVFLPAQSMYSSNAEFRINLYKDSQHNKKLSPESKLPQKNNLKIEDWVLLITSSQRNLNQKYNNKINRVLQNLAKLPLSEKKKTLLFIPQSNKLYWDMQPACETAPFIAPAITGIAMIDGYPKLGCDARSFGYKTSNLRTRPQSSLDKGKNVLCSKALSKGFFQIIVIDTDREENISTTKLSCP